MHRTHVQVIEAAKREVFRRTGGYLVGGASIPRRSVLTPEMRAEAEAIARIAPRKGTLSVSRPASSADAPARGVCEDAAPLGGTRTFLLIDANGTTKLRIQIAEGDVTPAFLMWLHRGLESVDPRPTLQAL